MITLFTKSGLHGHFSPDQYKSMKYDNEAFFQSLMMQMWDTILWETNESDEGFQYTRVPMFSSQLGEPPVAPEEHSAPSSLG